jgi:hypothetical protein
VSASVLSVVHSLTISVRNKYYREKLVRELLDTEKSYCEGLRTIKTVARMCSIAFVVDVLCGCAGVHATIEVGCQHGDQETTHHQRGIRYIVWRYVCCGVRAISWHRPPSSRWIVRSVSCIHRTSGTVCRLVVLGACVRAIDLTLSFSRVSQWRPSLCVGDLFVKMGESLKLYHIYVKGKQRCALPTLTFCMM